MFEDNPLDQEWIYQPDDGTIMSSSTGLCLTEHVDVSTATLNYTSLSTVDNPYDILSGLVQNHVVFVSDCDSATKWDIGQRAGGSIVSRTSKRCLEVSTNDLIPIAQGKRIQTGICQVSCRIKYYSDGCHIVCSVLLGSCDAQIDSA
jgi:hypothetical protein